LVLRLNQETSHDFVSLFLPTCGLYLTPLATWSLEPSLIVFSTPGGLIGDDLSCLFFTCTNTSQAITAPAILSQESVHTTLSITHHTGSDHPPVLEPHMVFIKDLIEREIRKT
jgi:hypothetical protein